MMEWAATIRKEELSETTIAISDITSNAMSGTFNPLAGMGTGDEAATRIMQWLKSEDRESREGMYCKSFLMVFIQAMLDRGDVLTINLVQDTLRDEGFMRLLRDTIRRHCESTDLKSAFIEAVERGKKRAKNPNNEYDMTLVSVFAYREAIRVSHQTTIIDALIQHWELGREAANKVTMLLDPYLTQLSLGKASTLFTKSSWDYTQKQVDLSKVLHHGLPWYIACDLDNDRQAGELTGTICLEQVLADMRRRPMVVTIAVVGNHDVRTGERMQGVLNRLARAGADVGYYDSL